MIVEYTKEYCEQVKELLVELQQYIASIDKEGYNIVSPSYKEEYFKKTLQDIEKYNGKMFLYKHNNQIVGLVVGLINNEEIKSYDFCAPKRGRITELVVSKKMRGGGIGAKLLTKMEEYLQCEGCKDILLGVFAYNGQAIKFYEKRGYHTRMIDMSKSI